MPKGILFGQCTATGTESVYQRVFCTLLSTFDMCIIVLTIPRGYFNIPKGMFIALDLCNAVINSSS